MTSKISRRDFVNGVLVGSGAALLSSRAPAAATTAADQAEARFAPSGSPWTGYGGVGDYSWSNGNTEAVRNAAHGIRDHQYPDGSDLPIQATHDLVVVGGGISGLSALYEYSKHRKDGQTALLLENHPVIGGEAKQNEFDVDGHRLVAPQGSNAGLVIKSSYQKGSYGGGRYDTYADYYRELQMPDHFELEALSGGAQKYNLATEHFDPMFLEKRYAAGYYFPGHGWASNPIAAQFKNTPWSAGVQQELDDFVNNRRDVVSGMKDVDRRLDSITYYQLLDKLGYGADVKRYIDPLIGVGNFGVCGDAISAYAAKRLTLPGTIPSQEKSRFEDTEVVCFPGGNAAIVRRMLKRILPDSIAGDDSLLSTTRGAFNFGAFDKPASPVRIRLGATTIRVEHEGKASDAGHVLITYAQNGKLFKVRARSVVVASGGWVTRNIVTDLPEPHTAAYKQFHYAPVLVANVAVRNWRFFDKLGVSVARSFAGLGWHVVVRRNVVLEKRQVAFSPDSPTVLTFYIPFLHAGADPAVQGSLGRAQLLATSYSDFEQQLRSQLTEMFGSAGFDAQRDIAGIVLNRWGHAYFTPPLGFFFGQPAAHELLRKPHGRIVFAHSELQGNMNMAHAMLEGRRGALQAIDLMSS
jgi:spermidine dehydrogenase